MHYTTRYDLASLPPIDWRSLIIPLGLAFLALLSVYFTRPGAGRKWLVAFAVIAILVSVGIPYWDRQYLLSQPALLAQGPITNHWTRDWSERRDGKNKRFSYEGFRVDTVLFGYFRHVDGVGFTNTSPYEVPLRDGLPVRIRYVPQRRIDDGIVDNRILKLDVGQP